MKRVPFLVVALVVLLSLSDSIGQAQDPQWVVGGRFGLSIYTVSSGSYTNYLGYTVGGVSATQAGLQIGPAAEVVFHKKYAICTELNINTQAGTPIEWANTFKYFFEISGSKIRPYADAGFNLWLYTGGPYFGLRFGGGALFPIAPKLYIPADLQLGPVFATGITPFYIAITSGIRYEI